MSMEFLLDGIVLETLDRHRRDTVTLLRLKDGREIQAIVPGWRVATGDRIKGLYRHKHPYALPVAPERVDIQSNGKPAIERELGQAILMVIPDFGYRRAIWLAQKGEEAFQWLLGEKPLEELFDRAESHLLQTVKEEWRKYLWYFQALYELYKMQFTPLEAASAIEELGTDAVEMTRKNPFFLVQVRTVRYHHLVERWQTTSSVGALLEAIKFQTTEYGHTLVPIAHLGLSRTETEEALAAAGEVVWTDGQYVALRRVRLLELNIIEGLRGPSALPPLEPPSILSEEQAQIFKLIQARACILTGGPGTGKTFTISTLVQEAIKKNIRVTLIAPTGKAAQRMQELSKHEASTIHRALGITPELTCRVTKALPQGLVILDEASMVGLEEMNWVVDSLPEGACLLLVGDANQLPPVSMGSPFMDLMGWLPSVQLSVVRRQGSESKIVQAAQRLLAGESIYPLIADKPEDLMYREGDAATLVQFIKNDVLVWIKELKIPLQDVQLITPVHGGLLGTRHLGRLVRESIAVEKSRRYLELHDGSRAYKGEKIIFTENQPRWGIMNGTIGIIVDIGENTFVIEIGQQLITLPRHLSQIATQGYAITVHRSQGSEWPFVILVLPASSLTLRKLVYTGITRAKKQLMILSEVPLNKALLVEPQRYTYLKEYIRRNANS